MYHVMEVTCVEEMIGYLICKDNKIVNHRLFATEKDARTWISYMIDMESVLKHVG